MKKRLKSAIMWCYEHYTLQGLLLTFQVFVLISCIVCVYLAHSASAPELTLKYNSAADIHVIISWLCTFAILIAGATKFGTSPFFPKFITYDAED